MACNCACRPSASVASAASWAASLLLTDAACRLAYSGVMAGSALLAYSGGSAEDGGVCCSAWRKPSSAGLYLFIHADPPLVLSPGRAGASLLIPRFSGAALHLTLAWWTARADDAEEGYTANRWPLPASSLH